VSFWGTLKKIFLLFTKVVWFKTMTVMEVIKIPWKKKRNLCVTYRNIHKLQVKVKEILWNFKKSNNGGKKITLKSPNHWFPYGIHHDICKYNQGSWSIIQTTTQEGMNLKKMKQSISHWPVTHTYTPQHRINYEVNR
jgi:hypothetical protein